MTILTQEASKITSLIPLIHTRTRDDSIYYRAAACTKPPREQDIARYRELPVFDLARRAFARTWAYKFTLLRPTRFHQEDRA